VVVRPAVYSPYPVRNTTPPGSEKNNSAVVATALLFFHGSRVNDRIFLFFCVAKVLRRSKKLV
jgi:hypothetical protein